MDRKKSYLPFTDCSLLICFLSFISVARIEKDTSLRTMNGKSTRFILLYSYPSCMDENSCIGILYDWRGTSRSAEREGEDEKEVLKEELISLRGTLDEGEGVGDDVPGLEDCIEKEDMNNDRSSKIYWGSGRMIWLLISIFHLSMYICVYLRVCLYGKKVLVSEGQKVEVLNWPYKKVRWKSYIYLSFTKIIQPINTSEEYIINLQSNLFINIIYI